MTNFLKQIMDKKVLGVEVAEEVMNVVVDEELNVVVDEELNVVVDGDMNVVEIMVKEEEILTN